LHSKTHLDTELYSLRKPGWVGWVGLQQARLAGRLPHTHSVPGTEKACTGADCYWKCGMRTFFYQTLDVRRLNSGKDV